MPLTLTNTELKGLLDMNVTLIDLLLPVAIGFFIIGTISYFRNRNAIDKVSGIEMDDVQL